MCCNNKRKSAKGFIWKFGNLEIWKFENDLKN
jgi:hypothetical protein